MNLNEEVKEFLNVFQKLVDSAEATNENVDVINSDEEKIDFKAKVSDKELNKLIIIDDKNRALISTSTGKFAYKNLGTPITFASKTTANKWIEKLKLENIKFTTLKEFLEA